MTNRQHKAAVIQRYSTSQRINHWLIAISFILLALSGLALFHPSLYWLSNILGGGPWTRILHPFIGVFMFVCFAIFCVRLIKHNLMTKDDLKWLTHVKEVLNDESDKVPPAGRYNAGQKVLFYVLIACMVVLLLSGIVMWRSYFSSYFSIDVIRWASLLHALSGFVLICSIIVHVYAAIWVQGAVQAMTRGTVSQGWAWRHHRLWFREWARKQASESQQPPK